MGGIVASCMAARFKERVKGVVLLGPVNPAESLKEVFGKRVEVVKAGTLCFVMFAECYLTCESPSYEILILRGWMLMLENRRPRTTREYNPYRCYGIEIYGAASCFHPISYPGDFP